MGFGMFSVHHSPIAIDFGTSSVKMLQIGTGDRPPLLAAAEVHIPDDVRPDPEQVFSYIEEWVPPALVQAQFKGRRAVIAVPSALTFVEHMQINEAEAVGAVTRDDLIKSQLQAQMGCPPHGVVVRPLEVCSVNRNGQPMKEVICLAIARDTVMRYVNLLKKWKIEAVGVHTDTLAMIRAFDHIHRRTTDADITTLYVDLGWGGTRLAITHGKQIVFARHVPIGGRHFDQLISSSLHCDTAAARAHRMSLRSVKPAAASTAAPVSAAAASAVAEAAHGGAAEAHGQSSMANHQSATTLAERRVGALPPELKPALAPDKCEPGAPTVNLSELLDTITDEMSMSLRYHQGLFPQRAIDRAIFVGGESRQAWLCQHIVRSLRVPAQLGDPLARLDARHAPPTPGAELTPPQPGWAVACGLCASPTDM